MADYSPGETVPSRRRVAGGAPGVPTNGGVSFWHAALGGPPPARAPLPGDLTVDVAIVGGGFTGLWTAWYLLASEPRLRVAVIEREWCGYGASGRNGGWLSGAFEWSRARYAATHGRDAVVQMQRALAGTVAEITTIAAAERIEADIRACDQLLVATNPAQWARARAEAALIREWDARPGSGASGGKGGARLLDAGAVRDRVHVHDCLGGLVIGGAARVQPARLVRGLADAVARRGVSLFEQTRALSIGPGEVVTDRGTVRAHSVIRATEGFTADLPGHERDWLPLNSAMIVTEPLPAGLWRVLGWQGHELVGDFAHAYCYAQRTADGRIAFGGRGVPYRYGSGRDLDGATQPATIRLLREALVRLFPPLASVGIDHAWCGVLGVPRDWCASVGFDPATRVGWAGGYVGLGVGTSNLAGRTLADLVLGRHSSLTTLPWVDRRVRPWEREPWRWLAVHSLYALYRLADRREARGRGLTDPLATLANRIAGR